MNTIGKTLYYYRRKKHLTQAALAEKLQKYEIYTTAKSISTWETGYCLPNAYQFLAVCDILDITDIYNIFIRNNGD